MNSGKEITVLFLHGYGSEPGGLKPVYLQEQGFNVLNPALPNDDFTESVRVAQREFNARRPDVVVGSSRGGAVAVNIDSGDVPLVLLCPAWKRWGDTKTVKKSTYILHSPHDEVVPFEHSQELCRNSGLPSSRLIEVGQEHRLAEEKSLACMAETIRMAVRAEG